MGSQRVLNLIQCVTGHCVIFQSSGDDGTDYDWGGNNANVADVAANAGVIASMQPLVERFFRDRMPPNPLQPAKPTPAPAPTPAPQCKDGWITYPNTHCAGKGHEKTDQRYVYQGPEKEDACKAKCLSMGAGCKCCDVGHINNGPPKNMCHIQNETSAVARSGESIESFVPCKK